MFTLLGMILLFPVFVSSASAQANEPELWIGVNDERPDFGTIPPEVHSGVSFAPVRPLADAMQIKLETAERQLTLSSAGRTLKLLYDDNLAINDQEQTFVMWQFLRRDEVMVPVAYIAGYFGYELSVFPDIPLLRLTSGAAALSDEQFAEQVREAIAQEREARKPPIYLTFDDGPSKSTMDLLDCLKAYEAKATFFMLGGHMTAYPDAVQRLVREGHQPGLHSMTHESDKFYRTPKSALEEMNQANKRLQKITETRTTLIRTPYGSKPLFTEAYRDTTAQAGYHLWDWNVDSNDWRYTQEPEKLYENVLADIRRLKAKQTTPIVLFHDQAATVSVLPRILEALREDGYRFAPLSEDMEPVNFWHDLR